MKEIQSVIHIFSVSSYAIKLMAISYYQSVSGKYKMVASHFDYNSACVLDGNKIPSFTLKFWEPIVILWN